MQNGFIERFNRSYREALLDMFVFQTLYEVREQTENVAQGVQRGTVTRPLWET